MKDYNKSDTLLDISVIIDENTTPYYTDIYSPGEVKEQLEIGKEVKGSASSITTAQITGGTFSVPDSTQTQCTSMSTIIGDSALTGTADQITIQTTGIYEVLISTRWQNAAGGLRNTHLKVNGTVNFSVFGVLNAVNGCTNYGFKILSLSAGDVLTLELYQSSGSALNTDYNNLAVIKLN